MNRVDVHARSGAQSLNRCAFARPRLANNHDPLHVSRLLNEKLA